ncbi:MFS general substrate transporter [Hesseltinella vesiculosa]|uniref:MFS general substrate transporter n=1 Tax=Hesseltinella vesiculosa TaxID=101127 RepID=A0A1X2G970_9FUNG|nr:MFS general substrate transporter [Hesseltinella vesiculosa]
MLIGWITAKRCQSNFVRASLRRFIAVENLKPKLGPKANIKYYNVQMDIEKLQVLLPFCKPEQRNQGQELPMVHPAKTLSDRLSLIFASIALLSDGYQANIIGAVKLCLEEIYGSSVLKTNQMGTRISNALLIGNIVGMIAFGLIIDRLGRKFGIVLCTLIVCLGIILATAAKSDNPTTILWLIVVWRGLTGVGTGGEYPCSSVVAGESAEESHRSRGFWLIFSGDFIIDVGFLVATIVPVILLAICGEGGLEVVWRLSLGLGLLLPLSVFYFRLKMLNSNAYSKEALTKDVPYLLILKHYWPQLLITGGIWFLYDFITYSFGLFSDTILAMAVPGNSLMQTFQWNIVLNVFYPFGSIAGAYLLPYVGTRYLLAGGFLFQAILGCIIGGLSTQIVSIFPLFVVLYGIFLALGEVGGGNCTIVIANEMYPTAIRGTMFGLSAAIGKAGAAIGTQVFIPIFAAMTEYTNGDEIKAQGYVFIIGSLIALVIAIISYFTVPDMTKLRYQDRDEEFRQMLEANGYDVTKLGFHVEKTAA